MTQPLVSLITTTGWRTKGFALTEKYIQRQTYKGPLQWIVVSDDSPETPTPCTMNQEYYQCPLVWKPGLNTQRLALDLAVTKIKGDVCVVIEDDDYLKPDWISIVVDFLKHAEMVGECDCTYYSLKSPRGFKEMVNHRHASLCSTAFRKSYLPKFYNAIHSGHEYIDIILWNRARLNRHKTILFSGMNLVLGMKGLPGRTGIGVGHQDKDFTPDPNFIKLKQLIGPEDAQPYIQMCKE